jgi:hypothetical protein
MIGLFSATIRRMGINPPPIDVRQYYDHFDAPVTAFDCGLKCAPHNPSGKPFCCDICQAVPAVYHQEWAYLRRNTDLWHVWRGDECAENPEDPDGLGAETPGTMLLLACQGPAFCQREYRALSCRQFPFFPYISSGLRFIGLAYEPEFENTCWVISRLDEVSESYLQEFIQAYDSLFDLWVEEFNSYIIRSEDLRAHYAVLKRRIPILHRDGGYYFLSPASERLQRVTPAQLPRFGPYRG